MKDWATQTPLTIEYEHRLLCQTIKSNKIIFYWICKYPDNNLKIYQLTTHGNVWTRENHWYIIYQP
jgi:hypothetical protein